MNTTRKLFGLALAPLYFAIAQVESENGVTSRNMYQLTRIYLDDCETLTNSVIKDDVVFDRQAAEQLMFIYWRHYGEQYEKRTGKKPTYEVLARIHNGGPRGYEKKATLGYWARVKTALEKGVNKNERNRTMSNLLDKHGNLMLFDAAGNRVTLAGNPHFIERSRHNKMLAELAQALTLLDTASQALVSAKQFISTMDKAGFINDANGELKNYQTKTDALLVGAKEFMNKYVNKEK